MRNAFSDLWAGTLLVQRRQNIVKLKTSRVGRVQQRRSNTMFHTSLYNIHTNKFVLVLPIVSMVILCLLGGVYKQISVFSNFNNFPPEGLPLTLSIQSWQKLDKVKQDNNRGSDYKNTLHIYRIQNCSLLDKYVFGTKRTWLEYGSRLRSEGVWKRIWCPDLNRTQLLSVSYMRIEIVFLEYLEI